MNVLSLFNGIGCAAYCLKQLNIPIGKLYVSEIDKYANIVNEKNHPESIQLGCVKSLWERRFDDDVSEIFRSIDLLVGGSPCQGFSNIGLGNNFDDPRSALFFHFVDILDRVKELNPNVLFMLENVKLKKEWRDVISDHMTVEPEFIDSQLVCAQMRKRYYWANWNIPQPEDRFVFLRDIIQPSEEVDGRYYLSDDAKTGLLNEMPKINPDKAYAVTANSNTSSGGRSRQGTYICEELPFGVLNNNGTLVATNKSTCIDANYHKGMDNHAQRTMIYQRKHGFNDGNFFKDKSPTITSSSRQNNNTLLQGYSLRRMTPTECCRLQGLPDSYVDGISDTQKYRCLGNGWQCGTIIHIFSHMPKIPGK